jgi:ATP-dependent Clp protease ATP-binding subunit ClpA
MFKVGKINKSMNPSDLYRSISKLSDVKFFADKFGISKTIIGNILDSGELDIEVVKRNIKIIMHDTESKTLTPGIILVSMLKSHPLNSAILKNMGLELHDLYDGIRYLANKDKQKLTANQIEVLDQINQTISRKKSNNIFLVGENGSGKTTLLKELHHKNVYLDAASLNLNNRQNAKDKLLKIIKNDVDKILVIDNANLILEEGSSSIDCSEHILQAVSMGRKLIICLAINHYNNLRNRLPIGFEVFKEIKLQSPNRDESLRLLLSASSKIEKYRKINIQYNALKTAYDLTLKTSEGKNNIQSVLDNIERIVIDKKLTNITAANVWEYFESKNYPKISPVRVESYYLIGPAGVGKSKFSEKIAEDLDGYSYYKINVSGAGRLLFDKATRQVSMYPRTVLYIENLDEAFSDLHSLLHQIMDDKKIHSYGKDIDFSEAVIIASSVLDGEYLKRYIDMGYEIDKIKDHFYKDIKPESLVSRFDNKLIIKPSNNKQIEAVISTNIGKANRVLKAHNITIRVNKNVRDYFLEIFENEKLGIDEMERLIQFAIENGVKNRTSLEVDIQNSDIDNALKALKKGLKRP